MRLLLILICTRREHSAGKPMTVREAAFERTVHHILSHAPDYAAFEAVGCFESRAHPLKLLFEATLVATIDNGG